MINETASRYGKVLSELELPKEAIDMCQEMLKNNKELCVVLASPAVSLKNKHAVIDKIFESGMKEFIFEVCDNDHFQQIMSIFDAYRKIEMEHENKMEATITYAVKPQESQLEAIENMLLKKYSKSQLILHRIEDKSILGGCIIETDNTVYDKSVKGILKGLKKKIAWG